MKRQPKKYKKKEPVEKYFIGYCKGTKHEIFKGDPKMMFVSKYPQYLFTYGPYETYEQAVNDAYRLGCKITPQ